MSKKKARTLADSIVALQGALFLRDLLRKKKREFHDIRIGGSKAEIHQSLLSAIDEGHISLQDLEGWLEEVEGWGKQHFYLFSMIKAGGGSDPWNRIPQLRAKAGKERISLDSSGIHSFPEGIALSRLLISSKEIQFIWHRSADSWKRDAEEDHPNETIDGYEYEFRAFKQILNRSIARFVISRRPRRAALFMQVPLGTIHSSDKAQIIEEIAAWLPGWNFRPIQISKGIKVLDQRDLDEQNGSLIQAQNMKFSAQGASVEFDADPSIVAWKNIPSVRAVRRALKAKEFSGTSGKFLVKLTGKGIRREVSLTLNGKQRRAYMPSQMTSEEVWQVVYILRESCK